MFAITQSNDTQVLLSRLIEIYKQHSHSSQDNADGGAMSALSAQIFAPFTVIVPSMVLGDWLTKSVASQVGISTLLTAQFWGQYQWQMIQAVLKVDAEFTHAAGRDDALQVPEVAVLSASVMRWRLFGFFCEFQGEKLIEILNNQSHPLHSLLHFLYQENPHSQKPQLSEQRIWQLCDELAAVYVKYLTHRPEWLAAWTHNTPLPKSVDVMLAEKQRFEQVYHDDEMPEWLIAHYHQLEMQLRYLWQALFADVYAYREALEQRFWQVLSGARGAAVYQAALAKLPKALYLFTVQQIPVVELQFLKRLSTLIDVELLHFNPSKMFWADIVDKNWLMTQRIIHPDTVYLKDHGHSLLSRLAKESRETFAMLADMSGGEYYYEKPSSDSTDELPMPRDWQVSWMDQFVNDPKPVGLLAQLKQDILMLDETGMSKQWLTQALASLTEKNQPKHPMHLFDDGQFASLSIHACHSLKRQLEIARVMIARYLNIPNADGSARHLSDVVVYLPDVAAAEDLIRLVFDDGVGADGLRLPAKITGTTNRSIETLMNAIAGFYTLLGGRGARFYRETVFEWLMLPPVYQSFGLDFEQMSRACELLTQAGFRRGFDAEHLAMTLDEYDVDYRYSFSYALDRLVTGLLIPDEQSKPNKLFYPLHWQQGVFQEATAPVLTVSLADEPIISALCRIHEGLSACYGAYDRVDRVQTWLDKIEYDVIDRYFANLKDTAQMRAIFEAKNSMAASLRANQYYHKHHTYKYEGSDAQDSHEIRLSLQFVLESLNSMLQSQAISAEPANVITFARFGALRSVPFGLTVMLDMNLSAFPRRDGVRRMDLMRAGLKRRGDRMNEDDDNGAFLDAILCSRDACMIFYNSVASDGVTELLPAAPVSELLEFFKTGVDWQNDFHALLYAQNSTDDTDANRFDREQITNAIIAAMPSVVQTYLVTHHTATSFDTANFYDKITPKMPNKSTDADEKQIQDWVRARLIHAIEQIKKSEQSYLPPAPLWQKIRGILDAATQANDRVIVTLPDDATYQQIARIITAQQHDEQGVDKMVDALLSHHEIIVPMMVSMENICTWQHKFSLNYLNNKIELMPEEDDEDVEEPLGLDGLGRYQLNDAIIQAMARGIFDGVAMSEETMLTALENTQAHDEFYAIYFDKLLPAGESRFGSLASQLQTLEQSAEALYSTVSANALLNFDQQNLRSDCGHLHYSQLISGTYEQSIALNVGSETMTVSANVADADQPYWLSISPSKATAKNIVNGWLMHLAWQVVCKTDNQDISNNNHVSIRKFIQGSLVLKPLGFDEEQTAICYQPVLWQDAQRILAGFATLGLLSQKLPLPITSETALTFAVNDEWQNDELTPRLYDAWVKGYAWSVNSSQHPSWQLILGASDPLEQAAQALPIVYPLYQSLPKTLCKPEELQGKQGGVS